MVMERFILIIALLSAFLLMGFSGNAAAWAMDDTTYVAQPVTDVEWRDKKKLNHWSFKAQEIKKKEVLNMSLNKTLMYMGIALVSLIMIGILGIL